MHTLDEHTRIIIHPVHIIMHTLELSRFLQVRLTTTTRALFVIHNYISVQQLAGLTTNATRLLVCPT